MTEQGLSTMVDPFVRSRPLEVAAGWVYGLDPATPLPSAGLTPREAFDNAIRPALVNAPCYVTFSGGRDSSSVLAAAVALARREGHQLPIPVTRIYPDLPATDESDWQQAVVEHLEITEWIRLEFRHGETDLLGDAARRGLEADGLLWPPAIQAHRAMFEQLSGGSLLTGEGGDAVLGIRRGTPLTILRRRHRPNKELLAAAVDAVLPEAVRRRSLVRLMRSSPQSRWLKPAALEQHAALAAADQAAEPLRYDEGTWFLGRQRPWTVIMNNYPAVAAQYGIRASDPLLDPGFLAALAHAGGGWGYLGRTATMRALFSDVLPPEVLARSSKASFDQATSGGATREFAQSWDGTGVDPELVDVEALRKVWLSDHPTMGTGMLLHSAWLASEEVSA